MRPSISSTCLWLATLAFSLAGIAVRPAAAQHTGHAYTIRKELGDFRLGSPVSLLLPRGQSITGKLTAVAADAVTLLPRHSRTPQTFRFADVVCVRSSAEPQSDRPSAAPAEAAIIAPFAVLGYVLAH